MKIEKSYWKECNAKSIHSGMLVISLLEDTGRYLELGSTHTQHAGEETLHSLEYLISDPCYFTPLEIKQYEEVTGEYLAWRENLYTALERAKEALTNLKKYWGYNGSSMLNEVTKKLEKRVL